VFFVKVLIVKTSSLGDVVQTFPVVNYLRQIDPEIEIHWVAERSVTGLLEAHPGVDRVITIQSKKWRGALFSRSTYQEFKAFRNELRLVEYDVVFDLQGNSKSALVTAQARSKHKVGFGKKGVTEYPNLLVTNQRYNLPVGKSVREGYLYPVQRYFKNFQKLERERLVPDLSETDEKELQRWLRRPRLWKGKRIMVCPGSAWKNKRVPVESLVALLELIKEKEDVAFFFMWGSQEERALAARLQGHFPNISVMVDELPLPVFWAFMEKVDLLISMDSLPLHLCATTSTPSLSFFGASSAQKYKPMGQDHVAVQGTCPYNVKFEKRCPRLRVCGTSECVKNLPVSKMYAAYKKL
jgi:heptosyltransferase-1